MDRKCPKCGHGQFHRRRETRTVERDHGQYVLVDSIWMWVNFSTTRVEERTYAATVRCAQCGFQVATQDTDLAEAI